MISPASISKPALSTVSAAARPLDAGVVVGRTGASTPNATEKPSRRIEDELDLSTTERTSDSADVKDADGLTPEQEEQVKELSARDREVRAHEQAHLSAAGPYARGGPTYTFQTGPDGRNYAIGGEVQIDTSPVDGDPEATIQKAQVVRAAALAPAEPSAQDRQVAAAATKMEQAAAAELRSQRSDALNVGRFLDLIA